MIKITLLLQQKHLLLQAIRLQQLLPAHNAEEPATVAQDVKALKDGEYNITAEALKFYEEGRPSMAAAAIDIDKTKLIVKNGQYSVNVSFKSITFGGLNGYLGNLKYYDGDKTHENRKEIQDSEFKDSTIVDNYSASETDNFVDVYKKNFLVVLFIQKQLTIM